MNVAKEVKEIMRKNPYYKHLSHLYVEAKKAHTILEIGLQGGLSTRSFLCGLRDGKQGHLWSIDWGKNPITEQTAEKIKQGNLSQYFTWIKRDLYEIPDLWFKEHPMDLIFLDLTKNYQLDAIKKCLLSMHKGSKLILLHILLYPVRQKFLRDLDKTRYHYETLPIIEGMAIITKDVDD